MCRLQNIAGNIHVIQRKLHRVRGIRADAPYFRCRHKHIVRFLLLEKIFNLPLSCQVKPPMWPHYNVFIPPPFQKAHDCRTNHPGMPRNIYFIRILHPTSCFSPSRFPLPQDRAFTGTATLPLKCAQGSQQHSQSPGDPPCRGSRQKIHSHG